MKDISTIDYTILDRPEVLMFLFHPRSEPTDPFSKTADPENRVSRQKDILIPVQDDIAIGARFHMAEKNGGNLLFFHGNGEIVADYDELGPIYNQMELNFLPVDYRGYGRSSGTPTVSAIASVSKLPVRNNVDRTLTVSPYNMLKSKPCEDNCCCKSCSDCQINRRRNSPTGW